jgi:hypothetical protein
LSVDHVHQAFSSRRLTYCIELGFNSYDKEEKEGEKNGWMSFPGLLHRGVLGSPQSVEADEE